MFIKVLAAAIVAGVGVTSVGLGGTQVTNNKPVNPTQPSADGEAGKTTETTNQQGNSTPTSTTGTGPSAG